MSQLILPISEGGFGLPDFAVLSPAAFVSSCSFALKDIQSRQPRILEDSSTDTAWSKALKESVIYCNSFADKSNQIEISSLLESPVLQHKITSIMQKRIVETFHAQVRPDNVDAARLLSLRSRPAPGSSQSAPRRIFSATPTSAPLQLFDSEAAFKVSLILQGAPTARTILWWEPVESTFFTVLAVESGSYATTTSAMCSSLWRPWQASAPSTSPLIST